jgi:hypothetical protein
MGMTFSGLASTTVTLASTAPNLVSIQRSDTTGRTPIQGAVTKTPTANTPFDLITPTAGKTMFITFISILNTNVHAYCRVGDNVAGNAFTTNTTYSNCVFIHAMGGAVDSSAWQGGGVVLNPPMKITTKLNCVSSATSQIGISFVGWEETT